MNLYIQLENNIPINHPIQEDNLLQIYPEIDTNTFAKFTRISQPSSIIGPYQKWTSKYVLNNDTNAYEDSWFIEEISEEEKQAKIVEYNLYKPFDSWIFNETLCTWEPPIPMPINANLFDWDESTLSWKI